MNPENSVFQENSQNFFGLTWFCYLFIISYLKSQEVKGFLNKGVKKRVFFLYKSPLKNGNAFVCCRLDKGFITEFFASINN